MKKMHMNRVLLFIVCVVLIAAMALFATGCGSDTSETVEDAAVVNVKDGDTLGEGSTQFAFTVVDGEGNETHLTVNTDKTVVGEALMELGLIAGEEGPYGLYVTSVLGIRAVYEEDGCYWSFYIDGEYGMTGVDKTDIVPGSAYMFKVEAA